MTALDVAKTAGKTVFCVAFMAVCLKADQGVAATPARCQEDQPCWTWSTMGNHHRGVILANGGHVVVGPCQFSRLYRAGKFKLDGQRLKGDWSAINYGCPKIGTALTITSEDS